MWTDAAPRFAVTIISDVLFFQAEDGIRDYKVTGVQTCALPISAANSLPVRHASGYWLDMHLSFLRLRAFLLVQLQSHYWLQHASEPHISLTELTKFEIGRASCRERV